MGGGNGGGGGGGGSYNEKSPSVEANRVHELQHLCHFKIGRCYMEMGHLEKAIQEFHKALEDDDSGKGVFLMKMKNAFVPVKRVYSVNTYL